MRDYKIVIEKPAEKFIMKLPKPEKEKILKSIYILPEGTDIKRLRGQKSKGFYRLRVGDYRIIYRINNAELIICIVDAGNRGQIYNRY
jgi:addiction module toxin, RelE/StbE family